MVNSILKVNVIDFPIIYESNKSDIYYLSIYSITFRQKKNNNNNNYSHQVKKLKNYLNKKKTKAVINK